MLAAAFSLLAHNYMESIRAGISAADTADRLRSALDCAAQSTASSGPACAVPLRTDMQTAQGVEPQPLTAAADVVEIDGKRYIGILSVPSLGLELPVQETYSESGLKQSPCRYCGSPEQSDLVIAGHSYKTHFGPLSRLSSGDEVLLLTASGEVLTYTVECAETLLAWQVEDMVSGSWDLTLFTCTVSGASRLAVRCSRCD